MLTELIKIKDSPIHPIEDMALGIFPNSPISYSCYNRYNYRSYQSIYTALVKRNHSVTMVLHMVECLRNWPSVNVHSVHLYITSLAAVLVLNSSNQH